MIVGELALNNCQFVVYNNLFNNIKSRFPDSMSLKRLAELQILKYSIISSTSAKFLHFGFLLISY